MILQSISSFGMRILHICHFEAHLSGVSFLYFSIKLCNWGKWKTQSVQLYEKELKCILIVFQNYKQLLDIISIDKAGIKARVLKKEIASNCEISEVYIFLR